VRELTESTLLDAWEQGVGQPSVHQAVTLAAAVSDSPVAEIWDMPLGARNALLLSLRQQCFGDDLACIVTCPSCGEELDVAVRVEELRADGTAEPAPAVGVGGIEVRFRAVTSRDLLAVDGAAGDARRRLVLRCVLDVGAGDTVSDTVVDAVAGRLGDADPQADPSVELSCASCDHRWRAPFDVAAHLSAEVEVCAQRLLHDIHCLAAAYGWREADVLAVSPVRRRYYLTASTP
jgi:hypothetical protein